MSVIEIVGLMVSSGAVTGVVTEFAASRRARAKNALELSDQLRAALHAERGALQAERALLSLEKERHRQCDERVEALEKVVDELRSELARLKRLVDGDW